jgi:glycerol-3-phosphate dehydrogenase (NAD(P)+)
VKIAVVGAGAWGTTLAHILSSTGETWLWAREDEVVDAIIRHHENRTFLPGFELAPELHASQVLSRTLDGADLVIIAVPSQHVRQTMAPAGPALHPDATIISATKGIELTTGLRMSEVLTDVVADHDPAAIGVLSGPNLAREVMAEHPSATCIAFGSLTRAEAVRPFFATRSLRVYTSDDVIGCEIGGASKNVIAIAAGVADGLGYGMNTKAALVTRGLAEITRLGVALGGRPLTFLGLAGHGDLFATCSSPLSRNRRFGEALAKGDTLRDLAGSTCSVAEGIDTAPALLRLADRSGIDMPISATVNALVHGQIAPGDVVDLLMRRDPKAELEGLG